MEFSGRLSAVSVADVLQWATNDRRTGALVVRRPAREKRVYFRHGQIVGCASSEPNEYYGQYLVAFGFLAEAELLAALAYCREGGRRLGVALAELSLLSPDRIRETLRRQIEDAVCDLFLWQHGIFYFRDEAPAEEEIPPEPIHTLSVVLEGTRWQDETARIRRVFLHDGVVVCAGSAWPGGDLDPVARRIVGELEGRLSLAALYERVRGPYFRFLEAAFALATGSVLDIESIGEETEPATEELSLYELLLEQAAEEGALPAPVGLAVPLSVLEGYYPVRAGEGADGPAPGLEGRIDGRTSVAELLAPRARGEGGCGDPLQELVELLRGKRVALLLDPTSSGRRVPPTT